MALRRAACLACLVVLALLVLVVAGQHKAGLAAQVVAGGAPLETAPGGHHASTLVLSCIDFRFVQPTARLMAERGAAGDYDQFVLAGASLGALQPGWEAAWWDHVALAIALHGITRVALVDHADCGMYKKMYPEYGPATATAYHRANQTQLATQLHVRHPALAVRGWLVALDGRATALV